MTIANMAIEAGGKSAIFVPDVKTREYCSARSDRPGSYLASDPDAAYVYAKTFDANRIEPVVAYPFSPENVHPISEAAAAGIRVDQAVIGSCTNGRIEISAWRRGYSRGRSRGAPDRVPRVPQAWRALKEGLIDTFIEAGAIVSPSTCGPCLGGHMGVLGPEDVAISTTNRNFAGRMGHPKAKAYLSNVAVCAASAVTGKISHPAKFVGD
jgi:3-isopropylmalate/(R)-2-methylmalate dehydratase large subunit